MRIRYRKWKMRKWDGGNGIMRMGNGKWKIGSEEQELEIEEWIMWGIGKKCESVYLIFKDEIMVMYNVFLVN